MVKISNARIDMERARIDSALFKDYGEVLVGGASGANTGAAFSIDLSAANAFKVVINAAVVDMSFINAGPSGSMTSFTLVVQQDSSGSRSITWPTTVLWDGGITPRLTATPGRMDIFSFMSPDGGRKWFGMTAQQNITGLTLSNTTLWGWGANALGKIGVGDIVARIVPTPISSDSWSFIASGSQDTFAIKTDGSLWGWGSNVGGINGQLGDNSIVSRSSPVAIGTLTNWAKVSTGSYRSSAIKTDGTLWGWGQNDTTTRLVGDNTATARSSPIQIGTLTNWASLPVVNIGTHTGAITTTGQLWMWGANTTGLLGDNTVVTRSSPTQVGTLTNWATLSVGQNHAAAVKTDGTLWAWGTGTSGQLGDNTATTKSSPVQVGSLTNWATIATGQTHSLATKTDGTLWTWGLGTLGQLGDNTATTKSSPVQVGSLTNWAQVGAGSYFSTALKTDGTLWSWGSNINSQLGLGDFTNRSSPTQVGNVNTWTKLASSTATTFVLKT